jgi:hypothetical protein
MNREPLALFSLKRHKPQFGRILADHFVSAELSFRLKGRVDDS